MAGAKWALGLFLLRIVQKRWHRMSIWLAMLLILFGSLASAVVFWLQCSPPKYLWDKSVRGHCRINATASSLVICSEFLRFPDLKVEGVLLSQERADYLKSCAS